MEKVEINNETDHNEIKSYLLRDLVLKDGKDKKKFYIYDAMNRKFIKAKAIANIFEIR